VRALDLNPNDADAHEAFGWYLAARGRLDEAERQMETAKVLDPRAVGRRSPHAAVLYYARRYDDAIAELRETLALDPSVEATPLRLGRVYSAKKMFDEAIAEIDRPGFRAFRLAELARVRADAGQRAAARDVLSELEQLLAAGSERLNPDNLAYVYAALGDRDRAFQLLDQAYSERSSGMVWLKVDPRFDSLRGDERFAKLLKTLGL